MVRVVLGALSMVFLLSIASAYGQTAAEWNVTQAPFKIYGNTYFVGVRGLSAILITSPEGHILIDGALPQSAEKIAASIRTLGFKIEDVRLILNSHVHFDHAGGLAELQRLSGASVKASESSAKVLRAGKSGPDDPQYGELPPIARIEQVDVVRDGETLHVGSLAVTAHYTPGHTPGGTSWTWTACEQSRCLNLVYADSLMPVAADNFLFTRSTANPHAVADFEKAFTTLNALPCDVLLTPHPDASDLWTRLAARDGTAASGKPAKPDALVDNNACRRLVGAMRQRLAKRLADERAKSPAK
jgi:metallo-beta-lactamase class B